MMRKFGKFLLAGSLLVFPVIGNLAGCSGGNSGPSGNPSPTPTTAPTPQGSPSPSPSPSSGPPPVTPPPTQPVTATSNLTLTPLTDYNGIAAPITRIDRVPNATIGIQGDVNFQALLESGIHPATAANPLRQLKINAVTSSGRIVAGTVLPVGLVSVNGNLFRLDYIEKRQESNSALDYVWHGISGSVRFQEVSNGRVTLVFQNVRLVKALPGLNNGKGGFDLNGQVTLTNVIHANGN